MLASLFMTGGTWYRIVGLDGRSASLIYFGYGYRNSALRTAPAEPG